MNKHVEVINERPLSTQDAWDRYCEKQKGARRHRLTRSKTSVVLSAVIVFVVVSILALAAIPLISTTGRNARSAEGEQLMGSARDTFREAYALNGDFDEAQKALQQQVDAKALKGAYYMVEARAVQTGSNSVRIYAFPLDRTGLRVGEIEFELDTGKSSITWYEERKRP